MKYPLTKTNWDSKEIEAIHSVVNSGQLTMGPMVLAYEEALKKQVWCSICPRC